MRDWHTALPGDSGCQTGWLGRAVDLAMTASSADAAGVFIGDIDVPFGIRARQAVVPRVRAAGDWRLRQAPGQAAPSPLMPAGEAGENPLADHVRRTAARAVAGSRQVEAVLQQAAGAGAYPEFSLAESLRCVAQLIRADLGIRMYFVELGGGGIGGFDNHANQRDNHAALLRELSESVTAFVDDLARQSLLDRVLVITFSEFGRTLTENGRRGTGHGAAAPMLLAGGRLRGGLSGAHPSLTDLEGDAPKFHTDFRRVYATCLDRWLRLDSQTVLGGRFEPLDLLA
jgi:uncharacterized protein (DUF1501 family)